MKTKAELEDEIVALKTRIAELEGAVAAYQYALNQINGPMPQPIQPWYQPFDTWPGLGSPPGQPVWGAPLTTYVLDNNTTE